MRKVWVEHCQLPGVVYDLALARMPEPTESKWQAVPIRVCSLSLGLEATVPPRSALTLNP